MGKENLDYFLEYYKNKGVNFYMKKDEKLNFKKKKIEDSEDINISNYENLDKLKEIVLDCKKCELSKFRNKVVFGEGNPNAKLLFIGEGPGEEEDKTGRPFVGRAGKLLTKIIEAMELTRDDVFIANIVKCRPPGNRNPKDEEIKACYPYLANQILLIKPKIIVTLGSPATCTMFNDKIKISKIRGQFFDWKDGIKLLPTYHPAYLLRNPKEKKAVWEDMKKVMNFLDIKV
jgi:uracil-DNA glycosylase